MPSYPSAAPIVCERATSKESLVYETGKNFKFFQTVTMNYLEKVPNSKSVAWVLPLRARCGEGRSAQWPSTGRSVARACFCILQGSLHFARKGCGAMQKPCHGLRHRGNPVTAAAATGYTSKGLSNGSTGTQLAISDCAANDTRRAGSGTGCRPTWDR